jgi:hypothetical protein
MQTVTPDSHATVFDLKTQCKCDYYISLKVNTLKKPNKEEYMVAMAWKPISLLSTFGKVLEAVT